MNKKLTVLAAACHPDDSEFMIAGTLLLLKERGADIHMWNLANGCLGSNTMSAEMTAKARTEEAKESAKYLGAIYHPPLFDDLAVFYDKESLARVSSVIRDIKPDIIFVPSLHDYMEDHQNTARLVVSGTFTRGMNSFLVEPQIDPYYDDVVIYHALPYGLFDALRNKIIPEMIVDITDVIDEKTEMLLCHKSQSDWLSETQGINAYTQTMQEMSASVAANYAEGKFVYGEGFIRHHHLGFSKSEKDNPIAELLVDKIYLKEKN